VNDLQAGCQISSQGIWYEEKTLGPIRLCITNLNA
jgi:hypothetical protein